MGNDKLEKLNPNAVSLLRSKHYKVYLLSILIEEILDFFLLFFERKSKTNKRGKWKRLIQMIISKTGDDIISSEDKVIIEDFQKNRTAEFHQHSRVRGFYI